MKRAAATASSMCVTAHILLSGSASFLASTLLLGTPSGISSELILENDALSLLPILSGWDAPTKAIRGRSSVDDTLESLTGEVAAPQEWDSVGIDINDSGETKYAVFRKGANEEEVGTRTKQYSSSQCSYLSIASLHRRSLGEYVTCILHVFRLMKLQYVLLFARFVYELIGG